MLQWVRMDAGLLVATSAIFVAAGVVKGVVGVGLPTIAMALLTLAMSPSRAAALLIVPSLATNLWQLRPLGRLRPLLRRLAGMQVGVVGGTLGGSWLFGAPAGRWAVATLGIALALHALWGLAGRPAAIPASIERWAGPLAGATTGLVTAATGVFVVPAVPYLQSLALERDELVQAMGVSFTASTLALAAGLWANAHYPAEAFAVSCGMLVPAIAGMAAGASLRARLSPSVFRTCFLACLLLLGLSMTAKELFFR
jgi:uncharacterized membrane protein YfcA